GLLGRPERGRHDARRGATDAVSRGSSLFVRGARSYPPGSPAPSGPAPSRPAPSAPAPSAPAPSTMDVRIVEGVIDAVGESLDGAGLPRLDARGLTIIPGLVDVHVH